MKLTEAAVKEAIEYWYHYNICSNPSVWSIRPHIITKVTAMPRSDDFCLTVKFK